MLNFASENLNIEQFQPRLNYPFIAKLIFAAGKVPRRSKAPLLSALPVYLTIKKTASKIARKIKRSQRSVVVQPSVRKTS